VGFGSSQVVEFFTHLEAIHPSSGVTIPDVSRLRDEELIETFKNWIKILKAIQEHKSRNPLETHFKNTNQENHGKPISRT